MNRIVTFGEILLRLSPVDRYKFGQSPFLTYNYGGSEANVAVALAGYGVPVSIVSQVPADELGKTARKLLCGYGVDDAWIKEVDHAPLGVYWLLPGYQDCDWNCLYHRKNSAFATVKGDEFDWDTIFKGASVFHFSGVTPALSKNLSRICIKACQAAKKKGVLISCDVNYRSKLWPKDRASAIMSTLCYYVDYLFVNETEISLLIGGDLNGDDLVKKKTFTDVVKELMEGKKTIYPDLKLISSVSRHRNAQGILEMQAILWNEGKIVQSEKYPLYKVVDSIGAGDAYAAAIIYGKLCGYPEEYLVNFGTAASCLKHGCRGDFNLTPLADIRELVYNHS